LKNLQKLQSVGPSARGWCLAHFEIHPGLEAVVLASDMTPIVAQIAHERGEKAA
jgi:hypothetical protein